MNRVYKVIWSKAKHCYVVTSEIARSVTKSASSARSAGRKGAAVLAMAALLFTAGGVLGEVAANVTDVTKGSTANVIMVTKDGGEPTPITIDNVANATEAVHATAADRATKDGNGVVIDRYYVKNADAEVEAGGTYVKVDNTVGKNLSALDTNLSALDTQVKANADAVAAEATARKAADQNNLKVGDDGVISKVTEDGTTSSAVNKLVLNKDGTNQITMDEKGIKVGTNSGVMDKDGFYAGGDDYEHASAALKWDGSIKGADGKFTVDKDGKADIGGDLTVKGKLNVDEIDLTKTGIETGIDGDYHVTSSTKVAAGKITSYKKATSAKDGSEKESGFAYDENGTSTWAKSKDADENWNKSRLTVEGTGIKSTATDGKNKASTNLSNNGFNTFASDGTNKTYTKQTAKSLTSQIGDDGKVKSVMNADGITNNADGGTITNSAKDLVNNASENMTNTVGKDLTTTVGGNMSTTVTGTVTEDFKSDLTTTIGGNKSETVAGTSEETVTGKKTEKYNGGLETTVNGDEKHTVSGSQTNEITGSQTNTIGGDQTTTVTGNSSLSANNITNKATEKLSNSATDIENKASKSILNQVGEKTSWKMTDGTVVESVEDASGKTNKTTTTAADTYQFVKDGDNTLAKRTSSTNDNLNITDGTNTYTKITTATGNKQTVTDGTETASTNLTKSASNTLIENGTQSVRDHMAADTSYTVMNEKGNGSRRQQTASEILDRVTDGTNTSEVKQTASEVATSAKDISNTAKEKLSNSAPEIENSATKSITDKVGDNVERTMTTEQIQDKVGKTTVTTTDGLTKLTDEDHNHTTEMDYANVTKDLSVERNTTLGKEGEDTNLTVNSKSEFKDTVKMDSTLEVDGESTFNNKVTITKGGLDVTGGTTTDTLTVTKTSEFVGRADFRNDVYMWEDLEVTGETRTDTLYVDHDGYVGGNLKVDGNIETHDAVLSADSRQVVTGRQLYQTNERVDRLDNRIKKVGANAAALAALRPGDFNPDDKFSIAAGFGSYRNASAAALGLFYRPNENVLLSLGTSFGDGENMVNAGVSVKFGRGKSMAERRKEMADEVSVMRDEMKNQNDRIAELEEMLKKQSELIEKLSKES